MQLVCDNARGLARRVQWTWLMLKHARTLPRPYESSPVMWPQDDSFRGHVDERWLHVLAARAVGLDRHPPVWLWRFFYIVTHPRV